MKILAHYNMQQISRFIQDLTGLHELYGKKAYDLDIKLKQFFTQCKTYYKQIGASTNELKFNELASYLETAIQGINPRTYEKVKVGRRENLNTASFHCMSMGGEYLKQSLYDIELLLKDAENTINNVCLNLIQSGVLSVSMINECDTIDKCGMLWSQLKTDHQISLVDKKLKTTIQEKDIHILIDKFMLKIRDL